MKCNDILITINASILLFCLFYLILKLSKINLFTVEKEFRFRIYNLKFNVII